MTTRDFMEAPGDRKTIAEWQDLVWSTAEKSGWHEGELDANAIAAKLALIHSEVSEALEELRVHPVHHAYTRESDGKPEGFAVELADVVIRVMDLAGQLGFDLEKAIATKHEFNETRPHRHGGKVL